MAETKVKAVAKYQRISPRKVVRVLRSIHGKKIEAALTMLKFMPLRAARVVEQVLKSAAANARHNQKMEGADLFISEAYVGKGPTLHRFQPISRGRANPIKHRSCHVTLYISDKE
jgi:large subunit ribosomal protein L22